MSMQRSQEEIFAQFANVAVALGHGHRLSLLELLAQGERDVDTLASLTGVSVASVSQHLQRLRHAGLVTVRREGRRRIYRLASDEVAALVAKLTQVAAECVDSVEQMWARIVDQYDEVAPVEAGELAELAAAKRVVIVDVRPTEEYATAHLPGAINLPATELAARARDLLPPDRELIVYCRGRYCLLTLEAVRTLRQLGLKVRRLHQSVPDWRRAGFPVETGMKPIH